MSEALPNIPPENILPDNPLPESVEIGDSVIYQTLQDEIVLLNMASQQYYGLDSVGADVWKMLLELRNPGDVVCRLQESYEVDAETARNDLRALIGNLVEAGLLKIGKA